MTELVMASRPILIVGEYFGEQEAREGKGFVGPSAQALFSMLRAAGIDHRQCHFTNVFNLWPQGSRIESFCGPKTSALLDYPSIGNKLFVRAEFAPELLRLQAEITAARPNVIIALGAVALWAVSKLVGIKKYRGTPIASTAGVKVLPTYSPSAVLRQWKLRPIVIADLAKALRESAFPQIVRPKRFIHIPERISDLWDFYEAFILPAPSVSADIETKQLTITEIGFSPTPDRALVVPFYSRQHVNFWPTLSQEVEAWEFVKRVLVTKPLIGQNFSYDLQYLWFRMGIPCEFVEDDTMILHHAMYPEMEKGLGFLGSIYTNEPSWKFMRADQETLKKED